MLLNGAHHGVEVLSIDMVFDAIEVLLLRSTGKRERLPLRLPDGTGPQVRSRSCALTPSSIDGSSAGWMSWSSGACRWSIRTGSGRRRTDIPRSGRKNGRDTDGNGRIDAGDGVDLNRNYPFRWGFLGEVGSSSKPSSFYYRGPEPGSEPETQAMMRLGESEHPAASISYHTGTVALLAPYTIDNVKDPTPNEAWQVGEYLVAGLLPHPQGKPFVPQAQAVLGRWHGSGLVSRPLRHAGVPGRRRRRDAKDEAERYAIVHTVRPSWMRLFDRYLDGPTLSGRVLDATGQPVVASVRIAELPDERGADPGEPAAATVASIASCRPWALRCRFRPRGSPGVEQSGQEVGPGRSVLEINCQPSPIVGLVRPCRDGRRW